MSQPELEPLAPELLRLLAMERSRPAPLSAMQARVLERIGNELLAGIPLSGPAGTPSVGSAPPALPSRLHRLPLAVGLVTLGGLGGAGVHAWLQKAPHRAPVTMVAPASAPAVPPDPRPVVVDPGPPAKIAPRAEPRVPARRPAPPARPAPSSDADDHALARDGELAAERALLEQARMALARGKPSAALALLSRHEREFETGRLTEERQALTILALAADHQLGAARANASKFRREFPRSILLRTIDAAIETPR